MDSTIKKLEYELEDLMKGTLEQMKLNILLKKILDTRHQEMFTDKESNKVRYDTFNYLE